MQRDLLRVGDQVQLRDPCVNAVGTVVELLRGDEHVRVKFEPHALGPGLGP